MFTRGHCASCFGLSMKTMVLLLGMSLATSSPLLGQFLQVDFGVADSVFNVLSFGAKGDGTTLDTLAVQSAFDACAKAGGGTVLFPDGLTFVVGPVQFPASFTRMHLGKGTTVRADNDINQWPGMEEGHPLDWISAASSSGAAALTNIAITGSGQGSSFLDARGISWWKLNSNAWDGHSLPVAIAFGPSSGRVVGVKQAIISDLTLQNGMGHHVQLGCSMCEMARVTVVAPPAASRASAVGVYGSPVFIHHCNFSVPGSNVVLHSNNTLMEHLDLRQGLGVVIGSLCDAWVTNITLRTSVFYNSPIALALWMGAGCAGRVWNVTYEDLTMVQVGKTLEVDTLYHSSTSPAAAQASMLVQGVTYRRIRAVASASAGSLRCAPATPCSVTLENVVHVDMPPASVASSPEEAAATERSLDEPPRIQWNGNSGYCGETSLIVAGLYYGQYASQFEVRATASPNTKQSKASSQVLVGVNAAATAIKMGLVSTSYSAKPDKFLPWVQENILNGYPVIIGVFNNEYIFYGKTSKSAGDAEYDHIVPVTGVDSSNGGSLTFSDNGLYTPGNPPTTPFNFTYGFSAFQMTRAEANAKDGPVYALTEGDDYGIVVTGVQDTKGETVPVRVAVNVNVEDPAIKDGSDKPPKASPIVLTVTVSGLEPNVAYTLYRYSSFADVPTSDFNKNAASASSSWTVQVTSGSTWSTTENIMSDDVRVYRAVKASASAGSTEAATAPLAFSCQNAVGAVLGRVTPQPCLASSVPAPTGSTPLRGSILLGAGAGDGAFAAVGGLLAAVALLLVLVAWRRQQGVAGGTHQATPVPSQ